MTALEPRVWVGDPVFVKHWRWLSGGWSMCANELFVGSIFVPGNQPKPTIDPAEMETIRTCKVVDWA